MLRTFTEPCLSLLAIMAVTSVAQAQATRTFVSGLGSDSAACSRTAPCRSFQQAYNVVTAGGEVVALDSAGYGALNITKGVQIIAPPGVDAAVLATTGDAIDVNAGATDTVVLRGLRISGEGTGAQGVAATTFKDLHIEDCIVSGFTGIGIRGDVSGNKQYIYVNDTIVRDNGDNGLYFRSMSGGPLYVSIDHSRFENNAQNGLLTTDGAKTTISQSIASGNAGNGFLATAFNLAAELNCDGCTASANGTAGFNVSADFESAVVRAARSTATDNATGFSVESTNDGDATFESLQGTNLVRGNATQTSGTITSVTSP